MSDEDYELAILRRKKMAKLMAQEKKQQASKDQEARVDVERTKLLQRFLASDARSYLDNLKTREPAVGKQIEDILLHLIVYRGLRQTIKQLDIRYIERQVKGEEPTIRVQRDGETSDFGSYVRDAIKKSKSEDRSD
ncbi:MAG: DNA-binding protein [Candidatus Thorarchaeota archaeon]